MSDFCTCTYIYEKFGGPGRIETVNPDCSWHGFNAPLIKERDATIATQAKEIERLTKMYDREREAHAANLKEQIKAEAARDRFRAALEHYNVPRAGGNCDCGKCDPGRIAREALA